MAGDSLFASANASRNLQTDAWTTALATYAKNAECSEINLEDTNEFFRAWLGFVMYGAVMIAFVIVPYWLCSRVDKLMDREAEVPKADKVPIARRNSKHKVLESTDIDFAAAKEHFLETSPLDANNRWRSVLWTSVDDLSEVGGVGMVLYFKLLRSLGLLFCFCSIFSMPSMWFAYGGDFVPDAGNQFRQTTLGNIGQAISGGISQEQRLVILGCQGMHLTKITPYLGWLDFIGVLSFICFVAYFRFVYIPAAAAEDDELNTTCRDFGVTVEYLPGTIDKHEKYEEELSHHLADVIVEARRKDGIQTEPGAMIISEVTLVRDWNGSFGRIQDEIDLKTQLDIAKKHDPDKNEDDITYKKYVCCGRRSLKQVIEQMEQTMPDEDSLPVVRAFVIVNSEDDRKRLMSWYRFANFAIFRCCQGRRSRFHDKAIRVTSAPEPSAIIWRNQDTSDNERRVLKVVFTSIWLVVMIISIVSIYLLNRAGKTVATNAGDQTIGDPACDDGLDTSGYVCNGQIAAEWTIEYARTLSGDELSCYCTTVGASKILESDELRDVLCEDWLTNMATGAAISSAVAVFVVVINVLNKSLISFFVTSEKHKSKSGAQASEMIKIAASVFLNMSLILFLVNYNGLIFNGSYKDFNRNWYGVVASTLCLNLLLNTFAGSAGYLTGALLATTGRWPCSTRKCVHQAELRARFENPEFLIAAQYAQLLATVFSTLVYSAGLPVLNFFAAAYMFITFWVDKTILLWFSRRPPAYDAQMPKQAANLLLWAGPLHLFSAMFMMSNTCTSPSEELGGSLGNLASAASSSVSVNVTASSTSLSTNAFGDRISRQSSWFFFVALVVIVALLVLRLLLWVLADVTGLSSFVKMLMQCCSCEKSARISPAGEEGHVRQIRVFQQEEGSTEPSWKDHINTVHPPASYKMAAHPDCADLVNAMSKQRAPDVEAPKSAAPDVEVPLPSYPPIERKASPDSQSKPEHDTVFPSPLQS